MSSRASVLIFVAASLAVLAAAAVFHDGARAQTGPLADFNADGCVDGKDLILLGLRYGCCKAPVPCDPDDPDHPPGCEETPCVDDPCYDAAFDIGPLDPDTGEPAPDGRVETSDLSVLVGEFGQGCS